MQAPWHATGQYVIGQLINQATIDYATHKMVWLKCVYKREDEQLCKKFVAHRPNFATPLCTFMPHSEMILNTMVF